MNYTFQGNAAPGILDHWNAAAAARPKPLTQAAAYQPAPNIPEAKNNLPAFVTAAFVAYLFF